MFTIELDKTNVKILKTMLSEARLSRRKMARKTDVSIGRVLSRMKKMWQAGIIKGYSAILDHEKLGYKFSVMTEISVSKGKPVEMEKEIAKMSNARAVYDVTGLTDATCDAIRGKN